MENKQNIKIYKLENSLTGKSIEEQNNIIEKALGRTFIHVHDEDENYYLIEVTSHENTEAGELTEIDQNNLVNKELVENILSILKQALN